MIKLAFIDRETMEEEVGWLNKSGAFWENRALYGEILRVDPTTLEILDARGYERFIGELLQEKKVRFIR